MIERELEHEVVERLGGDAGLDVLGQHVEGVGGKAACLAHAIERFGSVQFDLAVAIRRAADFDIRHVLVPDRSSPGPHSIEQSCEM